MSGVAFAARFALGLSFSRLLLAQSCDTSRSKPATAAIPQNNYFVAIGDSYSAGPGAGDAFDDFEYDGNPCFRSNGSYPVQLGEANNLDIQIDDEYQFLSCTGHVTSQVIQYQIPDINWPSASADMKITLSIGGNNIGFADVLKYCLVGLALGPDQTEEKCNDAMDFAMNLLNNEDGANTFKNDLYDVWSSLFESASSASGQSFYPLLKQTGYPRFFNADTDICDDAKLSIGSIIPWAPVLSKDLRQQMNDLAALLNQRISEHLLAFETDPQHYYALGRMNFIDINDAWEGHRLCEDFVEDPPGFGDDNVWIFGIAGSDSDDETVATDGGWRTRAPALDEVDPENCDTKKANMAEAVACTLAQLNATNDDEDVLADFDLDLPQWVAKLFHPKTAGHAATKQLVLNDYGGRDDEGRMERREVILPGSPLVSAKWPNKRQTGNETTFQFRVASQGHVSCLNTFPEMAAELGSVKLVGMDESPNLVLFYDGSPANASRAETTAAPPSIDEWTSKLDHIMTTASSATVLASRLIAPANASPHLQQQYDSFNAAATQAVETRVSSGSHVVLMSIDAVVAAGGDAEAMMQHWVNGAEFAAVVRKWI